MLPGQMVMAGLRRAQQALAAAPGLPIAAAAYFKELPTDASILAGDRGFANLNKWLYSPTVILA